MIWVELVYLCMLHANRQCSEIDMHCSVAAHDVKCGKVDLMTYTDSFQVLAFLEVYLFLEIFQIDITARYLKNVIFFLYTPSMLVNICHTLISVTHVHVWYYITLPIAHIWSL